MDINEKVILTSIQVEEALHKAVKLKTSQHRISIRNLVERAMYLYVTDSEFRRIINNQLHYRLPSEKNIS